MADTTPNPYAVARPVRRPWWQRFARSPFANSNIQDLREAGQTMIASAARLSSAKIGVAPQRQTQDWMAEAWTMFDLVGELHFLATTLARRASRARFYVGKVKGSDVIELLDPEEVASGDLPAALPSINDRESARLSGVRDKKARKIFNSLGDGFLGVQEIIERGFVNEFVVGACYLAGAPKEVWAGHGNRPVKDVNINDLEWRALSVQEFMPDGRDYQLKQAGIGDATGKQVLKIASNQIYVVSVWNSHPADRSLPDSPVRASLPVLRELVGLTMHVSAQIDSRLAGAGMLYIRASVSKALKRAMGIPEDDPRDPFTELLIDSMLTSITNRDSASAVVPFVVTIPDETIDLPKFESFDKPLDQFAPQLREEGIRRIALGLDAPPELLLGQGDASHWTAWLTQEEVVDSHIAPTLALFARGLTTEFLRPILVGAGLTKAEAEEYAIWFDTSGLTVKANQAADAKELYKMDAISDEALRRANGFDEADAPKKTDVKDQAIDMVKEMVAENPGLMNRPGLDVLVQQITALLEGNPQSGISAARAAVESSGSSSIPTPAGTGDAGATPSPAGASGAAPRTPAGAATNPTAAPSGRARPPQTSVSTPGLPQTRAAASASTAKFGSWDDDQLTMEVTSR